MKIDEVIGVLSKRGYTYGRVIGQNYRLYYRFVSPMSVYNVYTDKDGNVEGSDRLTKKDMNLTQFKKHLKTLRDSDDE